MVLDTFICDALLNDQVCPICHPSCAQCSSGKCTACAAGAVATMTSDSYFCTCNSPTNWELVNHFEFCCDPSCPLCVDSSVAGCMTDKRQVAFLNGLAYDLNLLMLDECEGFFCFYHHIPIPSCNPLTSLVGTIASDENGMHPTWDQCMEVFKLSWPFVTYWFGELFPDFTPPSPLSETPTRQSQCCGYSSLGPARSSSTLTGRTWSPPSTTRCWTGACYWPGKALQLSTLLMEALLSPSQRY